MNKKQNSLMRFSRTERLAQLSEQEIVIERKKREIQAKLEAQKKKQTEEALKKLESSRETKKPGLSKKLSSGVEHHKNSNKEKFEQVKESLTNAFSNDGSFLDQFKKLSQTGLAGNNVDVHTLSMTKGCSKKLQGAFDENMSIEAGEKGGSITERDHKAVNGKSQSTLILNPLDTKVQFQIPPPGVVFPQHQRVVAVDNPASTVPSHSVPLSHFQGGIQNPLYAFSSKSMQLNSSQFNFSGNVQIIPPVEFPSNDLQISSVFGSPHQDDTVSSELSHSQFPTATLASIQPPLPITPQNIPPPSPIQVQNIPPPPIPPSELPKLRSESISMTLKSNTVRKLEAIPNPLEVDQPPSPPSPKGNHLGFTGTKENCKESFFNTTPIIENVSSHERDSSRFSSAFYDDDEDGEESGSLSDEKYHHWADLVARCGDGFEESLRNRNQNDANIRFLLDKNSKEYQSFRKLVSIYRKQLRSSGEEPLDKTRKLNSPLSFEGSESISGNSETKYSRIRTNDDENFEAKECLSSKRTASDGRQENQTHSKNYETRLNYIPHIKLSELKSKEDCVLPSQKLFPKETSGENSKDPDFSEESKTDGRPKRKRKSRWGDAVATTSAPGVATNLTLQPAGKLPAPKSTLLSQLTRSDPGLIQYARQTFGSTNLSEEDWKKAEDHYKINLLYQDMVKKRAEVEKLERQGKFKYEYDSDEDTEGGTWEHKLRQQEMQATQLWAEELTRQAAGKHHIGDFLPPEELERFMEKYNAVKEGREPDLSDYKEYKLKEDNVGYRLLQKMGWNEGQGLGQDGSGITNPVNKATTRHENQGLGIERPDGLEPGDDEYDAYRKRMMLAYRFRPNPLNNPRRPYY